MKNPKVLVVVFPGSNCDRDVTQAIRRGFDLEPLLLWHQEKSLPKETTHVILPGGFSFGDYVRAGALAARSPIMHAVQKFADDNGRILGICNGFQILCEANLLPGTLLKNNHGRFICSMESLTWRGMSQDKDPVILKLPIAHNEGRYFVRQEEMASLISSQSIALFYNDKDEHGHATINGSMAGIAGIVGGKKRNILGLMPHPERVMEHDILGGDGRVIMEDFLFG